MYLVYHTMSFFVLFCLLTDYMLLYVTNSRFYCRLLLLWRRCSFISWCLYLFIEAYYSVNTAKLIDPLGFVKNKRSPHNLFAIRSDQPCNLTLLGLIRLENLSRILIYQRLACYPFIIWDHHSERERNGMVAPVL